MKAGSQGQIVEGVVTQEEVSYPVRLSSQMIRDEQFLGL
jgi:hypothetical protein